MLHCSVLARRRVVDRGARVGSGGGGGDSVRKVVADEDEDEDEEGGEGPGMLARRTCKRAR